MEFSVTFKTPGALKYALDELDCDCVESHCECQASEDQHKAKVLANKYIKYDEYVTIEFDTDTGTATVVKCQET